jgi:hypothetical protein
MDKINTLPSFAFQPVRKFPLPLKDWSFVHVEYSDGSDPAGEKYL